LWGLILRGGTQIALDERIALLSIVEIGICKHKPTRRDLAKFSHITAIHVVQRSI
jgi:hypothetical protein